jgi:hypothetical protein
MNSSSVGSAFSCKTSFFASSQNSATSKSASEGSSCSVVNSSVRQSGRGGQKHLFQKRPRSTYSNHGGGSYVPADITVIRKTLSQHGANPPSVVCQLTTDAERRHVIFGNSVSTNRARCHWLRQCLRAGPVAHSVVQLRTSPNPPLVALPPSSVICRRRRLPSRRRTWP